MLYSSHLLFVRVKHSQRRGVPGGDKNRRGDCSARLGFVSARVLRERCEKNVLELG